MLDESLLLAIVEVSRNDAVQCMAPGCGHVVHKRIHVVRHEGRCLVLGSTCFRLLFHGLRRVRPRYPSPPGHVLTAEQRALLAANTEALINEFETAATAARPPPRAASHRWRASAPPSRPVDEFTDSQRRAVEPEVLRLLAQHPDHEGIDYRLAGWRGVLNKFLDDYLRGDFPSA